MQFNSDVIGTYANFGVGFLLAILALATLSAPGAAIVLALMSALCFFNFLMFRKMKSLFTEEEFLKSEVRKMELRGKLSDLGHPDFRNPPNDDS